MGDAGGPAVRAARALDPRCPRPGPDCGADHAGDADADVDADADDGHGHADDGHGRDDAVRLDDGWLLSMRTNWFVCEAEHAQVERSSSELRKSGLSKHTQV